MNESVTKVTLRDVPVKVVEVIKDMAKRNRRSFNSEAVILLEKSVEKEVKRKEG